MRRDDALALLRAALPELRREFAVDTLALFGSTARDEAGPGSDVDVIVRFDGPGDLLKLGALQERLVAIFGRPVDVATEGMIHRAFRSRVLAEAVNA